MKQPAANLNSDDRESRLSTIRIIGNYVNQTLGANGYITGVQLISDGMSVFQKQIITDKAFTQIARYLVSSEFVSSEDYNKLWEADEIVWLALDEEGFDGCTTFSIITRYGADAKNQSRANYNLQYHCMYYSSCSGTSYY